MCGDPGEFSFEAVVLCDLSFLLPSPSCPASSTRWLKTTEMCSFFFFPLSITHFKCVLSQFWRLDVRGQSGSKAALTLEATEKNPFLPLPALGTVSLGVWLHHSNLHLCLHCSLCISALCVSYKDTVTGLRTHSDDL